EDSRKNPVSFSISPPRPHVLCGVHTSDFTLHTYVLQLMVRPVRTRQFGISTHLYHGQRLTRDHLLEIAAHGFETVEVFATRTHFDYHNEAAVADLQQWLAEAGLTLHGVHAPIGESYAGNRWGPP